MKSIKTWLGPVVFGLLLINVLRHYGSQWDVGHLGMPSALLDASGKAYQDGAPADDAVTVAIAGSGHEQEAWLAVVALLIMLLIWAGMTMRRVYLDRKKIEATRREIRRLYGLPEEEDAP